MLFTIVPHADEVQMVFASKQLHTQRLAFGPWLYVLKPGILLLVPVTGLFASSLAKKSAGHYQKLLR